MTFAAACCLALLSISVVTVNAITNGELFDLLKDNLHEVDEYDVPDSDDDTLYFPGDANEEVDMEHLMENLVLNSIDFDKVLSGEDGQLVGGGCSCRRDYCRCCGGKSFSVKILWKRYRAKIYACVTLEYLRSNFGFRLTFVVNGRTMYRKEVSLKHPPAICYKIPGVGNFARVCLEIYNVNLRRKSMCTRLVGIINLKVKKWRFRIKLACFHVPTGLLEDMDLSRETFPQELESEVEQMSATTLAELFRVLKIGEGAVEDAL